MPYTDITKSDWAHLREKGLVASMDLHFAGLMEELSGENPHLFLAAAFTSSQTRFGHVCLDLGQTAGSRIAEELNGVFPDHDAWIQALVKTPVVGRPGDVKPLILDDSSRLFLYRYWMYQDKLARFIHDRVNRWRDRLPQNRDMIRERLDRLFPVDAEGKNQDQKRAACVSHLQDFSVISGGPGTGKTTTVAKLLILLIESHPDEKGDKPLRIHLTAPTGKAAARLKESMEEAFKRLDLSDAVKKQIPDDVTTIHRMLGYIRHSPYFRYNERNKLPADIVIVDEASMVDLALMSKLTEALHDGTRLILIGDQDQLASVEAGAVLGDICNTGQAKHPDPEFSERISELTGVPVSRGGSSGGERPRPLANSISVLTTSFRFDENSGIGALSRAVNHGDVNTMVKILSSGEIKDVSSMPLPDSEALKNDIEHMVCDGYGPFLKGELTDQSFALLDRFRVLCAVRKGPYGVEALNRIVEKILGERGLIHPSEEWYPGRPVMVTRNDYNLGLFNGDVGVVIPGDAPHQFLVAFPDNTNIRGIRTIRPDKLPDHETVFAMTVHKSQGSEFDKILLILPGEEKPVLTRELVYTGITRAKKALSVMADPGVLVYAVQRRTRRQSGLRDVLWKE